MLNGRNKTIDFLRGTGVILVLLHHLFERQGIGKEMPVLHFITGLFKTGGWIGVDLFFVLSGFLVSGLIFKEYKKHGNFDPKGFLIRRGFKIYPLYYILIAFEIVWWLAFNGQVALRDILGQAFFVSNYVYKFQPLGHLWSLSVEEHFYFFLAAFLFFLIKYKRLSIKPITYTYLFFLVFGFACRYYNYLHYTNWDFMRDYSKSHFRFDNLFFGVVLAYIYHYNDKLFSIFDRIKTPLFIVCLALVSCNFFIERSWQKWIAVWGLALNPILFGYITIYLIKNQKFGKSKLLLPIAYIGKYSYAIYLVHLPIIIFCKAYLHFSFMGYYIITIGLSLFIGIFSSKLIEYPLLGFRDKFFPAKSVI